LLRQSPSAPGDPDALRHVQRLHRRSKRLRQGAGAERSRTEGQDHAGWRTLHLQRQGLRTRESSSAWMDVPEPSTTASGFFRLSNILTFLAAIYLIALLAVLVFKPVGLFERDGYFHARYANLLPSFGLSRSFHWTQASTWRSQFCDKEFLFHVLMMPF